MNRIARTITLALAASMVAAAPPKQPDAWIVYAIQMPFWWQAALVQDGRTLIVTDLGRMSASPLWAELEQWAADDVAPGGSELANCFAACKAQCNDPPWACGTDHVEYTGGEVPSCKCFCRICPTPGTPPPDTAPPSKAAD